MKSFFVRSLLIVSLVLTLSATLLAQQSQKEPALDKRGRSQTREGGVQRKDHHFDYLCAHSGVRSVSGSND